MATKAGLYAEDRGYQGDIRPVRRVNEPRKRGRRNGGNCVRAGVRLTAALDQTRSFRSATANVSSSQKLPLGCLEAECQRGAYVDRSNCLTSIL